MTNERRSGWDGENASLWTYRVNREFEVSARSEHEAQALLDEALAGGAIAGPAPVQQTQVVLPDGDVMGVLGWSSVDPRSAPVRPGLGSRSLSIGVVVWDDQGQDDPTLLAGPDFTSLARALALLIHQRLTEGHTSASLATFLEEHPPAQDWAEPQDVDDWLEALRSAASFPAFSFHEVPVTGGADGTNRTQAAQMLALALAQREQELGTSGAARDRPRGGARPAPGPAR